MPAPKAVLRDIADFNLDPTQKFGRISSKGRLAHDGNGVTTTTTQGRPPVATGNHFRFYGRTASPLAAESHVGPSPSAPPVEEAPAEVEPEVEKQKDPTDEEVATVPDGKKGRFKKAAA